jgi:hypothetical protein
MGDLSNFLNVFGCRVASLFGALGPFYNTRLVREGSDSISNRTLLPFSLYLHLDL